MNNQNLVQKIINLPFFDSFIPQHQLGPDYIIPTENKFAIKVDDAVRLHLDIGYSKIKPASMVTFVENAVAKHPNSTALVTNRNSKRLEWTFVEYLRDIRNAAKGFIKLGLERFHGVGILGYNAPEWAIAYFASIFAGGLPAGIYTTNSPDACLHVLNDSSANIVIVENENQLEKILSIREQLSQLKAIIQYIGKPTHPDVISWDDLLDIGKSVPEDALIRRIRSLSINQCCTIIYTSATTGTAKGVMLHHDNILYTAQFFAKFVAPVEGGNGFSYLPLSHVAALMLDMFGPFIANVTCHFPQADVLKGKLVDYLVEVRPVGMIGVPRVFEKMSERIQEAIREMSRFKKKLFYWAQWAAVNHNLQKISNPKTTQATSLSFKVSQKFVLNTLKQKLGLDKCVLYFVAGAPMRQDILNFFISLDIIILDVFGLSEACGPAITNTYEEIRIGTVGKTTPGEIKIHNPDEKGRGELLLKGRNIFMGYLNLESKTKEAFQTEEWFYTGDIASRDENGYVSINGRLKELIITSGGENIAPVPIEEKIKELIPIISHCMVVGEQRKYLTLLITLKTEINMDTMIPTNQLTAAAQNWCKEVGSSAKTVSDIIEKNDLNAHHEMQSQIDIYNMNYSVSNAQRIQKWVVLPQDFSLPGGEIGSTLKLKRHVVLEKYNDIIEAMYT